MSSLALRGEFAIFIISMIVNIAVSFIFDDWLKVFLVTAFTYLMLLALYTLLFRPDRRKSVSVWLVLDGLVFIAAVSLIF